MFRTVVAILATCNCFATVASAQTATLTKPPLPKVVLLGDATCARYAPLVTQRLAGQADTLLVAEVRQANPGPAGPYDRRGWTWFRTATHFETYYAPNSSS